MSDKIDFVITWVKENDPQWQKERNTYAALEHKDNCYNIAMYRDWDTLKYWFRGVEKFAPWVNKIFFVTWGHLPEWLDINHPKLQIIKHSDFIPAEYLPTFNSNVIEYYFHKIDGLSDKFVYFNDDMFLINSVKPTRFFSKGLPCDLGGITINIHNGMFGATVLLAKTIINDHFNKQEVVKKHPSKWFNYKYFSQSILNLLCSIVKKEEFTGFVNPHLPQAFLKETYEDVWANCEKDLKRTSKNRFRDYGDIAFWLFRYWQLVLGRFAPYNTKKDSIYYLVSDINVSEIVNCITKQEKRMVCLNDSDSITTLEDAKNRIKNAFNRILPDKCSFER